jgi:hypothetical protein
MFDINSILQDIAKDSNESDNLDATKQRARLPDKLFTKTTPNPDVLHSGDLVTWTAANAKNEIIAVHEAEVIRVTKTKVYIKTRDGYFRYVSQNRLKKN